MQSQHNDRIATFCAHSIITTPAPITLTGPSVTTSKFIINVTCETTSVSFITHSYCTRTT